MMSTKPKIRLLFCADGALLGQQIAAALTARGHSLQFGVHDDGRVGPSPAAATVVIWSPESIVDDVIVDMARRAFSERALCPVTYKRTPAPAGFTALPPVDLVGWRGGDEDPRWRFLVDDIDIAAQQSERHAAAAEDAGPNDDHPVHDVADVGVGSGPDADVQPDAAHPAAVGLDPFSNAGAAPAQARSADAPSVLTVPPVNSRGPTSSDAFAHRMHNWDNIDGPDVDVAGNVDLAGNAVATSVIQLQAPHARLIAAAFASLLLAIGAAGIFASGVGRGTSGDDAALRIADAGAASAAVTQSNAGVDQADLPRLIDPPPVVAFVEPSPSAGVAAARAGTNNPPLPRLRDRRGDIAARRPAGDAIETGGGDEKRATQSQPAENAASIAAVVDRAAQTALANDIVDASSNGDASSEHPDTVEPGFSENKEDRIAALLDRAPNLSNDGNSVSEQFSQRDAGDALTALTAPTPTGTLAPAPTLKPTPTSNPAISPTLASAAPSPQGRSAPGDPRDRDDIAKLAWSSTAVGAPAGAAASVAARTDAIDIDPVADVISSVGVSAAPLGVYFRDCVHCPDMAELPTGAFVMGAPVSEAARTPEEGPQVTVTISRPFAIGVREVTFAEWDACAEAGGCNRYKPRDSGWGRGRKPVINVSYEDAQDYVAWLSASTGNRYRLPSEAEWEFAARAGASTPFHTGNTISDRQANYHGDYPYGTAPGRYLRRTASTGSFPPNAFGIYDVHGNVWEWTADCWRPTHEGAPVNGAPVGAGQACGTYVIKGGAWNVGAWRARAGYRRAASVGARDFATGFRVVRDLN